MFGSICGVGEEEEEEEEEDRGGDGGDEGDDAEEASGSGSLEITVDGIFHAAYI